MNGGYERCDAANENNTMTDQQKRRIAREAAQWILSLQERPDCTETQTAFHQWHQQSADHERAWRCAEQLQGKLTSLPENLAMPALNRSKRMSRRDVLQALTLLIMAGSGGWAFRHSGTGTALFADYRTAAGEQKQVRLSDGTRLHLNTATALDLIEEEQHQWLHLHAGEIHIETSELAAKKPLTVVTRHGTMTPVGTQFTVRQDEGLHTREHSETHLNVQQGAVLLEPRHADKAITVNAGQMIHFSDHGTGELRAIHPAQNSWREGVLRVNNQSLGYFIRELSRYKSGILRCESEVADLRISGVFRLNNIDQILTALPETLPVTVHYRTGLWVTVASAR